MKSGKILSKRIVVLAVLVVALSAAVYLNWMYSEANGTMDLTSMLGETQTDKYLGDAKYVNATAAAQTDYFEKTKQDRETQRAEDLETLKDIVDDVKTDDKAKSAAVEKIAQLTQFSEDERSIETLVQSKGFENCVAVVSEKSVNVVVQCSEQGLLASETAQIQDAVTSVTDTTLENIKIIEIK